MTGVPSAAILDRLQQWELTLFEKASAEVPVEVIGPFRTFQGQRGGLVGFNYALPVDPLDASTLAQAISSLRAYHRAHRDPLRIEFNDPGWPGLSTALEAAGMRQESANPLMTCQPRRFHPKASPSVQVRFLETDPRHPSTRRAEGEIDGVVAGRASLGAIEGIAELYAVVTEPIFRRRGVAATVCSALIQQHFDQRGTMVFLDAENPGAERLYEGLGFERVGMRLTYVEPSEDGS